MKNYRLCKEDYQEIRMRVGMREAAAYYGYKENGRGFCLCPFHPDKHPSMKIYPDNRGYYCFSCGNGGDVINFVGRLFGLNNEDAARRMIHDFSLPIKTEGLTYREIRERKKQVKYRQGRDAFYRYAKTTLSVYRQLLCEAVKNPGDDHFVEALQELTIIDYRLDCLEHDLDSYYTSGEAVKKVGEIRDRVINWYRDIETG